MDATTVARIREEMAYEAARTAPPESWPALPDLPLGRYTDPAFFELERDRLWRRVWLYAGHVSELPEPGSFVTLDVVGVPVVLVRGDDGEVRAFNNSCRHRGAPVVRDERGCERQLRCQFHSWAYDLAGRLVRVPDERDFAGLCPEDRGLVPVRCEWWGGWLFVNLDAQAVPLSEWLAPAARDLPELAAAPLRMLARSTSTVACNWKVTAEAFLEVYHLRTVHPRTVAGFLDHRGATMGLLDHGHTRMVTPIRPEVLAAGSRTLGLPEIEGLDPLFAQANVAYGLFPDLITPLDTTGFPFLVFRPVDVGTTRLDVIWFAPDWGDGDPPGVWEARRAGFDVVMQEDERNMEPIQRSIEAAAHGGVPLSYQERRIWHVHAWVDRMIGAERIPDELRVPPLLDHLVER